MTVVGNHVTKDAKPSEKSSEMRTTDGQESLVRVGVAESYSTLTDLPKMSPEFLEKMEKLERAFSDPGARRLVPVVCPSPPAVGRAAAVRVGAMFEEHFHQLRVTQ